MVEDLSRESVLQYAQGKDASVIAEDLRELSQSKLKELAINFEVGVASDKASTITTLSKAIVKAAKNGTPSEEDTSTETQSETEAPKEETKPVKEITSTVMARGEKGPVVGLSVNPAYEKMVPRPSRDDYERIKASIKEALDKGGTLSERIKVRDVDGVYEIIDGHTRKKILDELEIAVSEDMIEILDIEEDQVEMEIVRLNLERRHLTDAQKIKLVQKYLPQIKQAGKKAMKKAKKAKTEADKIAEQVKRAEERAKTKKANEDRKKALEEIKAKKKAQKEAEKKAKEAEKATKAKRKREGVAEMAGVAPGQVKLYDWLKKWVPKYLEEETNKGVEVGTIYGVAHGQWYKTVKKYNPELLEKVEKGKMGLFEAYEKALEKKPPEEHKPGPQETLATSILAAILKILNKKYGPDLDGKLDEYDADIINMLNARITKLAKANS